MKGVEGEKVKWIEPETTEEKVAWFLNESFQRLETATFGGNEEFESVLEEEINLLQESCTTTKSREEIKSLLREEFNKHDPEKTEGNQSSVNHLIQALDLKIHK